MAKFKLSNILNSQIDHTCCTNCSFYSLPIHFHCFAVDFYKIAKFVFLTWAVLFITLSSLYMLNCLQLNCCWWNIKFSKVWAIHLLKTVSSKKRPNYSNFNECLFPSTPHVMQETRFGCLLSIINPMSNKQIAQAIINHPHCIQCVFGFPLCLSGQWDCSTLNDVSDFLCVCLQCLIRWVNL